MAEDVISLKSRRKRRTKARKRWKVKPRFFLLLLSLLLIWVAAGFVNRYVHIAMLKAKIVRVEREIAALETRNEAVRQQLKEMQTDAYIERMAREKLGLVKPGEIVYIPVHAAAPGDPPDVAKRPGGGSGSAGGY
ncbi:MAG: septum formation initiator family protein [Firmicutes bacterium]|nr:septum formation initiator family protein [Bacillota bacterium]